MDRMHIDLYDQDAFARRGIPHDQLAWLRAHDPVHWHAKEEPDGPGYWAITKYADLAWISKHPLIFSSARGATNIMDMPREDLDRVRMIMINMDPPQHVKFRAIVRTGFTPRMIDRLQPAIDAAARAIVDGVIEHGACDFVEDVSAKLPLEIICELLGVPEADRPSVFAWTNTLIGFDDPEFQRTIEDAHTAMAQVVGYALEQAAERRARPRDDLISLLTQAEVDGHSLSDMEIGLFVMMLAIAGNETTRNATTQGIWALLEHPDSLRRLLDDMTLLPSAIEEILRWTTPVIHFRRTATQDVELRGKTIREGDKLALYYPSANRDEEVFEDPQTFKIDRDPNDHLSFGIGEHFCLGANLARMELTAIFREVLTRMQDLALDGEPERLRSNFIHGVKRMPLRFTPERARMRRAG